MDKEKLEKVLLKYTGMAGAILGVQSVQAQSPIIHTDIPDTTLSNSGDFYNFNIDQDTSGIIDFRINLLIDSTANNLTGVTIEQRGNAANQVAGVNYSLYNYASKLNLGDSIGVGTSFHGINLAKNIGYLALMVDSAIYPNSQWVGGVTDGFLGVRFRGLQNDTMRTFYGWIRLDIPADQRSVTIKDFAYHSEEDSAIAMGQLFLDQEELEPVAELPKLQQRGRYLDIEIPDTFRDPNSELRFTDISGREIKSIKLHGYKNTVELNQLPSGILIANVSSNGVSSSVRVVIY